ncbi:beta-microseminoprotein [Mastacembelus armatus]|uniref:beta-microseminoprotein n=1 Tax=Mastacembelus armatus TaxID=205130 RepID=UPI000E4562D6|nr:beta-microseminoprotein [Mastacembelus armatus]
MKYLALALLLSALLSLSNAQCYRMAIEPGMTRCQDSVDKTWHDVGSKWRNSQCMDCTCTQCCAAYSTPTSFPEDCVSVFDQKACKYIVHKKDDPSVLCPIFGAVMK